jgi:hypothetical protein
MLNLKKLETKLDFALSKEKPDSLKEWLMKERAESKKLKKTLTNLNPKKQ